MGELLAGDRGALLVGPPGVGKSTLVEAVVAGARRADAHVVLLRGTRGASEIPLGPFLSIIGRSGAGTVVPLFTEIRDHVRTRAAGRGVVFAVDDVDLLDDASSVLVHQAVSSGEARLLATIRDDRVPPSEVVDLMQRGHVVRVDVGPLDRTDADTVAQELWGEALDGPTLDRLWHLCAGNALLLRELIVAARERGSIGVGDLPLDAPNLTAAVESRLALLAPPQREALLHLAFAEPCGPGELASVADTQLLAGLEDAGVIVAEPDGSRLRLRLSHPLYGEVLRAATRPMQRRAVLATLARDLQSTGGRRRADIVRLGRLAVDGGVDVPLSVLQQATSLSYHSGDLVLSERIGQRAFETSRSFTVGWDLAHTLNAHGDIEGARDHLAVLRTVARRPSQLLGVGIIEAQLEYWLAGDQTKAIAALDRVLQTVPEDEIDPPVPTLTRAEVEAVRAFLNACSGRADAALAAAEPLLRSELAEVRIRAALGAGVAHLTKGRPQSALAALDQALADYRELGVAGLSLSSRHVERVRVLALATLGRLEEARRAAERISSDTTDNGYQALSLTLQAMVANLAGRQLSALSLIERAASATGATNRYAAPRRWMLATLAVIRTAVGDLDGADEALAHFDADVHAARAQDSTAEIARSRLLVARNFPEQARDVLRAELERDAALGHVTEELLVAWELARQGRAAEMLPRVEDLVTRTEGPVFPLIAGAVRGKATGDAAQLGAASNSFASYGFDPLALETAVRAGAAAGHGGDARLATRWNRRAKELADRCELVPALGDVEVTAAITRREREIALLASNGLSSKEIGSRLFISTRTVENHLAKVYTKLGVRSRSDLATVFGPGTVAD